MYTFRANAEIGKLARAQGLGGGGGGISIQLGATSTTQCPVVVPQGVQPGQTFQINVNGTIMGVQCPAGMGPGSTFSIPVSIQPQPQPQPQVVQGQAVVSSVALGGGLECNEVPVALAAVGSPRETKIRLGLTREKLAAFYTIYDPSKLGSLDTILDHPALTVARVNDTCRNKYGVSPMDAVFDESMGAKMH